MHTQNNSSIFMLEAFSDIDIFNISPTWKTTKALIHTMKFIVAPKHDHSSTSVNNTSYVQRQKYHYHLLLKQTQKKPLFAASTSTPKAHSERVKI